ncbi:hypothetical protein [Phenylobacterium sp.]|uniref:hypothetical protein n=1 Tax=Phenylobacterium sp. TaxID=1871053 RepID=UPI003565668C
MSSSRRLLSALALAAVFAGAPALAAEPEAVATAPQSGPQSAPASAPAAAPGVAAQIDDYLKTSPAIALPQEGATGITPGSEPRKIHGVVDVTVGTGGYRSAYVRTDVPIGKSGTASIAVGETQFGNRFGGRFGYGGRQSLGLGLRFDDAALGSGDPRCRQAIGDGELGGFRDLRIEGAQRPCPAAGAPASPQ